MTVDIEKYIRRALERCMRGAAGDKAEVSEFNSIKQTSEDIFFISGSLLFLGLRSLKGCIFESLWCLQ
jgi:hypothetical protein